MTLSASSRSLEPTGIGYLVLAGALTAQAALAMDSLLPALPSVARALDLTDGSVQLAVGVFMIGFAVGQIAWGWLADWLGRRPIILLGTGGYVLATLMCALSDSGADLIAWRAVQGLFSSGSMAATRAMLRDSFSGVELARKMAAMTVVFFLSPILAPQASGLLLQHFGWRSVFAIPGLIGGTAFLVTWGALAESHPPGRRRRLSADTMGRAIAGMLRHPLSSLCLAVQGSMSIGLMAWLSSSSLIVTGHYQRSVAFFGLIFAATATVMLLGSLLCNQLLRRRGAHEVIALGGACCAIGGLAVFLGASVLQVSLWALLGAVFVYMLGFGLIVPSSGGMALHAFGAMGGVAAAVVGSAQSLVGSTGSLLSAWLYDGSPRALGIGIGLSAALAFTATMALARRLYRQPDLLVHPEEIAPLEDIT